MRRPPLAILLLGLPGVGCATLPEVEPPVPPALEGPVPAIGRTLDLEVEGRGIPVRLQGVTGRATAVCVLTAPEPAPSPPAPPPEGLGGEGTGGEEPAGAEEGVRPSAPAPPEGLGGEETGEEEPAGAEEAVGPSPAPVAAGWGAFPDSLRVLAACEDLAKQLADRIAVVGLATSRQVEVERIRLRTYLDPGGEALSLVLDLPARPQVILVDVRGRVARIVGVDELPRLLEAARPLAR